MAGLPAVGVRVGPHARLPEGRRLQEPDVDGPSYRKFILKINGKTDAYAHGSRSVRGDGREQSRGHAGKHEGAGLGESQPRGCRHAPPESPRRVPRHAKPSTE